MKVVYWLVRKFFSGADRFLSNFDEYCAEQEKKEKEKARGQTP